MRHTPTPWQTYEGVDGAWFVWNANGGISTKDLIGSCVGRVNPDHRDSGQAKADATFIVRACNAHEELAKTATDALAWLRELKARDTTDNQVLQWRIDDLAAALAKAEGK